MQRLVFHFRLRQPSNLVGFILLASPNKFVSALRQLNYQNNDPAKPGLNLTDWVKPPPAPPSIHQKGNKWLVVWAVNFKVRSALITNGAFSTIRHFAASRLRSTELLSATAASHVHASSSASSASSASSSSSSSSRGGRR
jgi:hypothetical protein